jgi:rhodanese-related sulfurtransferase
MIAIGVMVMVLVLVAGAVIPLALRRVTLKEAEAEARLHLPETHTVVHLVPSGVDAAAEMAALRNAGFTSVVDLEGGYERTIVECDEVDRERVRAILDHVDTPSSG